MHDLEQGHQVAGPRRLAAVPAAHPAPHATTPAPAPATAETGGRRDDNDHGSAAPVIPGDRLLATAGVLAEGATALHRRLQHLEPDERDAVLDVVSTQMHELVNSWTALVKSIVSPPGDVVGTAPPEVAASPERRAPRPAWSNHPAGVPRPGEERSVPLHDQEPAAVRAEVRSPPAVSAEPSMVGSSSTVERREPPRQGRDELTGVLNRAAGLTALEREIDRCRRGGERFVLGYLNVDRMTAINDTRGLRAGDEVLRKVTAALRATLRSYDVIARLGGDEFLFSVPGADVTTAELRFKEFSVILSEDAPGTSASVGFAELHLHDTLDELVTEAETAMLKGRRQRRRGRG